MSVSLILVILALASTLVCIIFTANPLNYFEKELIFLTLSYCFFLFVTATIMPNAHSLYSFSLLIITQDPSIKLNHCKNDPSFLC